MALMDRVKAQATVLAQKAQETARDQKAKYDHAQAKRRGDVLLRNLGAAVYAERTGRGSSSTEGDIDRLIEQIKAHEAQNGISLTPESPDQPPTGGVPPQGGPAEGDSGEAGTAEAGTAEGGTAEGGTAEGGTAEGGTAEGGSTGSPPPRDFNSTTQV
jgi:hypothetical protein